MIELPNNLVFRPLTPLALWATLALMSIGLLAWYFTICRSRLGAVKASGILLVMGLAAAGPLVILLNPTWLEPLPPPPDKPRLSIVVDRSPSMNTCDTGKDRTRYEVACQAAAELAESLSEDFDLRLLTFSDRTREAVVAELGGGAQADGSTDLAGALDEALSDRRLRGSAVVLLSDGAHTLPGGISPVLEAGERARAAGTPLYTHTIGGPVAEPNLSIQFYASHEMAYVDQESPLSVRLTHQSLAGRSAEVALRLIAPPPTDAAEAEQTRTVVLDDTGAAELTFDVKQSEVGLYRYRVEAKVGSEEATLADNEASTLLRVVDQPIKIALLEGKPYWDSKFLLRNLAADPSTEVVSYVRMGRDRCLKRTLRAPSQGDAPSEAPEESWEVVPDASDLLGSRDALSDFQIVVLGRDVDALLGEEDVERLRDWVSYGGGALVCARGAPISEIGQRLHELLPLRWSTGAETRFRVGLTDIARELRSLGATQIDEGSLEGMPSLSAATRVRRTKPLTTVLAESTEGGSPRPVIAYRPLGTGVVIVVEGAGMWRWAFLPPDHADRDNIYGRVWGSMIRWMVSRSALLPGQDFALVMDKVGVSTNEVAIAQLLTRDGLSEDKLPVVTLTGNALKAPIELSPQGGARQSGVYRLMLGALRAGSYTLQAESPNASAQATTLMFDVRDPYREQLDLDARPELMARLAERSGGAVIESPEDIADQVKDRFDQYLANATPPQFSATQVWDRPWVMLAVLGTWAASWAVRRRCGLI